MESIKQSRNNDPKIISSTPDVVRGLSLSEVSELYGTIGLLTRLEHSLQREGMTEPKVNWALNLSLALHSNDKRTNGYYTDHILRVTIRIIDTYEITDIDIIIASLLHDAVEDHPWEIVKLLGDPEAKVNVTSEDALQALNKHLDDDVVTLLRYLTVPFFDEADRDALYAEHVENVVTISPKARVIKLSDFVDNAVGNHYTKGPKRERLDKKYQPLYRVHKMALMRPDSLISPSKRQEIMRQLTIAQNRALARLAIGKY